MSYEILEKAYNSLTAERQKNVEQFIYFLVEQQSKETSCVTSFSNTNLDSFESIVDSFIGCTHAWDNTDIMEYQQKLRGEYKID